MGILEKFGKKKGGAAAKKADKPEEKKDAAPGEKAEKSEKKSDKKAEKKEQQTRGPLAKEGAGSAYRILIRPVFTEKTSRLQAQGKYVFIVSKNANKIEVSRAIRDLYGVAPVDVNITVVKGKSVRFGRTEGREQDLKKAIVTLKSGETLTVVEGA